MRSLRRSIATAVVAVSLLVLGACSDGTESPASDSQPTGEEQQTEDTDATGGSEAAGAVQFDPEDVIVEQTSALANPDDKVTVGLQSLVVDGQVMTLTMVVTPDFSSVGDDEDVSLFDVNEETLFRPTLLDRANLKEYSVTTDAGTAWASRDVETRTRNGTPMRVFAVFAAPEDDINTVEVSFRNEWAPFTDVPIER